VAADARAAAADVVAAGKGGSGGAAATAATADASATGAPGPPPPIDRLPAPGADPRVEYVLPDGVTVTGAGFARPVPPRLSRAERVAAAAAAAAAATAGNGGGGASMKKRPASGGPPPENVIRLGLERFAAPETLFHPGDAGSMQAGVAEAAAGALAAAPPHLRPLLASRVLLVGGGAACPGFAPRFAAEFAPQVPDDLGPPAVLCPRGPALAAWRGGAALAVDASGWAGRSMTKAEYEERGSAADRWCAGGLVR
jgi:hypothetical protein